MNEKQSSSRPDRGSLNIEKRPEARRIRGAALLLGLSLAAVVSCSLLVEQRAQQCKEDADCKSLDSNAICSKADGVCMVPGSTSGSGGTATTTGTAGSGGTGGSSTSTSTGTMTVCEVDGGVDGGGCWGCEPKNDTQILNQCTDGKCVKFDNKRVTKLPPGGKLPALP